VAPAHHPVRRRHRSYGIDCDTDLADLLRDWWRSGDGLHVRNLGPGLLPSSSSSVRFCLRKIRLPAMQWQHRILEAMGRKYRVEPVMAAVRGKPWSEL
jgi:hypothetical protein